MNNLRIGIISLAILLPTGCANLPGLGSAGVGTPQETTAAETPRRAEALPRQDAATRQTSDLRSILETLQDGRIAEGRTALVAYLDRDPDSQAALGLLRQIDTDPVALLGADHTTYEVQRGDTLGALAARHLGDPAYFLALARYNGIARPRALQVGQKLRIPASRLQDAANGPTVTASETPVVEPMAAASPDAGDSVAGFRRRIEADLDAGRIAEAMAGIERARRNAPGDGTWNRWLEPLSQRGEALQHQQRGIALMRQGDNKAAYTAFGLALAGNPAIEPARRHAAELKPRVVSEYHEEAVVQYRNQQLDEAIALWDKVLELEPGFEQARGYRTRALELKRRLKDLGSS